ncbi:MAG: hypothetical protein U5L45_11795 [Saprospiraceae bacterium]|nr:hypothetical protein [Saprospiraceae bacterium]
MIGRSRLIITAEADGKGIATFQRFVYIIGDFQDTLRFGNFQLTGNGTGTKSGFLAKYDTLGNFHWAIPLKGTTVGKEVTTDECCH